MQPLSRNQRPDLLTSLMNMSFVLRLPRKMHLCRSSSNVPLLPSFLEMPQNPHVVLTFDNNPLRLPRETTSEPPKVGRTHGVFDILSSKCASRHNGVHFFDIATSKSGPKLVCFVHVDFEMCFARQRRALFRHRKSQLLKLLRARQFFTLLTSKCASRHKGVQFFISHLASWLRTRRFREPTFRPSGATNHWKKHSVSRLSYLFAHLDLFLLRLSLSSSLLFSSLLFSSLTLPISAFHLSILSEVWLLNFLRSYIKSHIYI